MKATLLLENGTMFTGDAIGKPQETMFHLVCNNAMTGYQEMITDPAYAGQGVVMTYPLVGNYGVCDGDEESQRPWISALIVRHLSPRGSNFRCVSTLDTYLKEHDIPGISGIDTRALTRILRSQGTMKAMLTFAESFSVQELLDDLHHYQEMDYVKKVTTQEVKHISGPGKKVAVLDFGISNSVLSALTERECDVTIYPSNTKGEELLQKGYDGIFLSGGPGNPMHYREIIEEVKILYQSTIPMFGLGLGHQILALAAGMRVAPLSYGHRGSSHPVRNMETGQVVITTQNHGYVVERDSVSPEIASISYEHVNDGTVEGLQYRRKHLFSVQFTPEQKAVSYGGANPYDVFVSSL